MAAYLLLYMSMTSLIAGDKKHAIQQSKVVINAKIQLKDLGELKMLPRHGNSKIEAKKISISQEIYPRYIT